MARRDEPTPHTAEPTVTKLKVVEETQNAYVVQINDDETKTVFKSDAQLNDDGTITIITPPPANESGGRGRE